MSQHDFTIANQTASSARSDINNALKALASNNSGTAAPSTTYANMFWYETDTNLLRMRNEANTGWITIGTIDQTNSSFTPKIGNWDIEKSGTAVVFQYNGTSKAKLDASGNFTVTGNVTAYGSV